MKLLLWDVGGVLLTNGWDRHARGRAVARFELDAEEFADRHEQVVGEFETGRMSLDRYLERTVFYRERPFSEDDFRRFMYDQSQPCEEALALAKRFARNGRYRLATVNNESRELAQYRIERFGLDELFALHLASGFVGLRKPDEAIYRLALEVTQSRARQCVFIDDRPLNIEGAARVGIRAVLYRSAERLRQDLEALGVQV